MDASENKQMTEESEDKTQIEQAQPSEPPENIKISEEIQPVVSETAATVNSEDPNTFTAAAQRKRKKKEVPAEETIPSTEEAPIVEEKTLTEEEVSQFSLPQLIEAGNRILVSEDFGKIKPLFILIRQRYDDIVREEEQKALIEKDLSLENDQVEVTAEPNADLHVEFKSLLSTYSKLRKENTNRVEAEKLRNLDIKNAILEELSVLVDNDETLQKTWEDFKRLQQQWKEIGHVPQANNQDLWNRFNHLVDRFLDKVKINRELRDLDYKKNLESKIDICEKIEALLINDSIEQSFKKLREYQSQWRETGPVPSDKKDEMNARFQMAIEKLSEKRKVLIDHYRNRLDENLELKNALIIKLKQINELDLTSVKTWTSKTKEVEDLLQMWKGIGPVPKRDNPLIWEVFKSEMNLFYAEKKKFFEGIKNEQMDNYNKKLLICKQAESLQESTDWRKSTEELIALQNEWKNIGPVPHRYSDTVWKRFRTACDSFFKRKHDYFSNIGATEEINLKAKQQLIEEMSAFEFGADNKQNLAAIRDYQRRFIDTGRVPIKEKDAIQLKFQQTVNSLLDKLKISKEEKLRFDFKNKYESMASSDQGQSNLKKESFSLGNSISKLESDIQLWENNIEFFAKSKNAELLTREFRQKIENAKAELLILKEKQKMLRGLSK